MYSGDWTSTDQAASGWGPEENEALATIYAGMDADAKRLFDDQVLGSKMRGEIRQKILEARAPQKQQELVTDFSYGGDPNKAGQDAAYFRAQAEAAQNRRGEVIDTTRGDEWRLATQQDRLQQQQALGLMEQRARGLVPSISEMQAQRDMGRAVADQSSIQAGARGAAGLALAQQNAANNSATLSSRISNDAQVNAANERLQAEQAWFGGLSGMRGQDSESQTIDLQTAQAQAGLNAAQRAQNDTYSQGMYGNEIGINQTQLAAHGNRQNLKSGQQIASQQVQANAQARADAQRNQIIGMVGTGISMGMGQIGGALSKNATANPRASDGSDTWRSDERAKTNAVSLGYAAGLMAQPGDGDPIRDAKAGAWDEGNNAALQDATRLSKMTPAQLKDLADKGHPLAALVRDMRANAWDEGRSSYQQQRQQAPADPRMDAYREAASAAQAQHDGLMQQGPAVSDHDAERRRYMSQFEYRWDPEAKTHGRNPDFRGGDMTAQLADGLAPLQYDYKPGMGPAGTETGISAQRLARNPLTAPAVRPESDSGLLALDPARSVKLSLAAAGNNAQEIQRIKQQLASFSGRGLYGGMGAGGM